MNAKEARLKTIENIEASTNKFVAEIDMKIESAIKNREFSTTVYHIPNGTTELDILKKMYEGRGFVWKVRIATDQRDENSLVISW